MRGALRAALVARGRSVLHGLPLQLYDLEREVVAAFRSLQSGSNIGKVVVRVSTTAPMSPSGAHLITGGTGGLGLVTGRWLAIAAPPRSCLRLASGSVAPAERDRLATSSACAVAAVRCDAAEEADACRAVSAMLGCGSSLGGRVARGGRAGGRAARLADRRDREARVRSQGARRVGLAASGRTSPLDACVLFSSVAALLGGGGQSNYAAANCCLDALARAAACAGRGRRRCEWGPWAEVGMAAEASISARLQASGMGLIGLEQGALALQATLQPAVGGGDVPGGGDVGQVPRRDARGAAAARQLLGPEGGWRGCRCRLWRRIWRGAGGDARGDPASGQGDGGCRGGRRRAADGVGPRLARRGRARQPAAVDVGRGAAVDARLRLPDGAPARGLLGGAGGGRGRRRQGCGGPAAQAAVRSGGQAWALSLAASLPSGIATPSQLRHLAAASSDGIGEVPPERWSVEAALAGVDQVVGQRVRHGGFLSGAELFDNARFGVSPAEAAAVDPQQRLLLERGYEALHGAGMDKAALGGSLAGVFLGIAANDWQSVAAQSASAGACTPPPAGSMSVASGRLSFVLGLQGPCVSYDTACSAALVASHAALRALQLDECSPALSVGVNLMLLPGVGFSFAVAGMTSPTGRCHTFDAAADGYVRGEACCAAVLAMGEESSGSGLSLLGSCVRQDGKSASLTAPNGQAQQALLRAALADGGVEPAALSCYEAHGTGTPLGDPIEVRSLAAAVLAARAPSPPLCVGSLKANCGHAEPAAGLAGLLRLAAGLLEARAPPNAQLRRINPHVGSAVEGAACALPTQLARGLDAAAGGRGGVSSFGYSGTIAHAVLEAAAPLSSPSGAATAPLRYKRRRFAWREAAPSAEAAAASVEAAASSHSYVTEFVPLVAAPAAALPTLVLGAHARPVVSLPTAPLPLEAGAAAVALATASKASALPAVEAALRFVLSQPASQPLPAWLLSSGGSQPCSAAARVCPSHAGLLGLARTARAEAPGSSLSHVDGAGLSAAELVAVASALPPTEPEAVASYGGARVPRLSRLDAPPEGSSGVGGLQLLTGGTGGVGLLVAKWLGDRGAAGLVLASRGGRVAPAESARLASLAGCAVRAAACDAAEEAEVRRLVAWASAGGDGGARLAGVWHAAGVLADGLLRSQTAQAFRRVYAPKAVGGWGLQRASAASPLDACVLFSSVAALLGRRGQANYSAANCCLDATSALRRAGGLASSSVQWGPWGEVGMAAEESINARIQASGFGLITMAEAAPALAASLGAAGPAVQMLLLVDWSRFLGLLPVVPKALSAFAPSHAAAAAAAARASGGERDGQGALAAASRGAPAARRGGRAVGAGGPHRRRRPHRRHAAHGGGHRLARRYRGREPPPRGHGRRPRADAHL